MIAHEPLGSLDRNGRKNRNNMEISEEDSLIERILAHHLLFARC